MKAFQKILFVTASAVFLTAQANAIMYFARPYDPNLQRWLTRDPLGDEGSLARLSIKLEPRVEPAINYEFVTGPFESWGGVNIYDYVENNPIDRIDPFGESSVDDTIRAAIARGDVRDLETLLDGNIVDDAQANTIRNALNKFKSKASDWISQKCKGSINREFPDQMRDKTLKEILDQARQGDSVAKKAWKLLNKGEYQK